jgi:hypothetical protein
MYLSVQFPFFEPWWRVIVLVVSSLTIIEEIGAMGREIESRQGHRVVAFSKNIRFLNTKRSES